jgi:hypothetical protein
VEATLQANGYYGYYDYYWLLMVTVIRDYYFAMELINALPSNISVNTVQQATIEEAVFRVRGDVTQQ